jgi:membrane protein
MTALDSIYEIKDRRPFWERMGVSVALAAMITFCLFLIGAILLVFLTAAPVSTPVKVLLFVGRLLLCAAILVAMVSILLRLTVPSHLEVRWLTLGSALSIAIWLFASWLFGIYVTNYAYRGYQQAFGVLSLLIVVMTYLYIASVAFLVGAELDALFVTESEEKRRTTS